MNKNVYAATIGILAALFVLVFTVTTSPSAKLDSAQRVPAEVIATDVCSLVQCAGQQSQAIVAYQADGLRQTVDVPLPVSADLTFGDQVDIMFDPAVGDAKIADAGRLAFLAAGGPATTALAAIAATIVVMAVAGSLTWGEKHRRAGNYSYA